MTLTGNPQNMIIGNLSGIPYARFLGSLAPSAWICLAMDYAILAWAFRGALASAVIAKADYFCTCDDRFLKRAKAVNTGQTQVVSPLELITEVTQ